MLALSGLRSFSLAAKKTSGRISCNTQGVFVGDVPLLERQSFDSHYIRWAVRPIDELNKELTSCYRLPIDISFKTCALALIANAFNRGDMALAAIATVQMQFPDPPLFGDGLVIADELARGAFELYRSGLLKTDPDWDAKHPRTGTPPNPGWFAPVGMNPDAPGFLPAAMPGKPWDKPDLPGGFGGGGGGFPGESSPRLPSSGESGSEVSPAGEPQPTLPFPGGLPPKLPRYMPGSRTYGIFKSSDLTMELQSGYDGPAASMPSPSLGFDAYTLAHVEGHAAALMRQRGIMEGTLYINNPDICSSCTKLLPKMLPPDATLNIVLPNGTIVQFKGNAQ